MVCWSRYLRHNPESYAVLAALCDTPGRTFSDIMAVCEISSPRLRSLLTHMQQYDLVVPQRTGWHQAPVWVITRRTYGDVSQILARRGAVTARNCGMAGV